MQTFTDLRERMLRVEQSDPRFANMEIDKLAAKAGRLAAEHANRGAFEQLHIRPFNAPSSNESGAMSSPALDAEAEHQQAIVFFHALCIALAKLRAHGLPVYTRVGDQVPYDYVANEQWKSSPTPELWRQRQDDYARVLEILAEQAGELEAAGKGTGDRSDAQAGGNDWVPYDHERVKGYMGSDPEKYKGRLAKLAKRNPNLRRDADATDRTRFNNPRIQHVYDLRILFEMTEGAPCP